VRLLVLALCLVSAMATADTPEADRAVAKDHTERGTTLYNAHDFDGALREFEQAYKIVAAPELEYDIARCLDQLDRPSEAADAYERYVAARPFEDKSKSISERAAQLRARHSTRRRPTPIAPAVLAAVTGVHLVIGATLLGIVGGDVNGAADHSLSSGRVHTLEHDADAGYAMMAIAGVAAVVDVALWVRWTRGPQREVAR
jgi:tetratricopeptide (TPR) repeat protein